ncbi:unnamed protein product [Macrosiphum euphorbiae]|uniref:Transposable element P transposase-like GTP-binding insertion domain-containing protein n=1 Tax=Macrosiphum euphorbiae TaxID=13131 RepID=A0AAV0YE00_9HEMI|nr:unnamed protein product [Macrosiphum euphorbiae]
MSFLTWTVILIQRLGSYVAMYEFDKKNEEFELRTLVKLNDNHINIARSKMKVSNAAQVFSHKVASTMKLVSDNAPKEVCWPML